MRVMAPVFLLACGGLIPCFAQLPDHTDAAREKFAVASIRINTGVSEGCTATAGGGQTYVARNCPLGGLIMRAYGLTRQQMGGPESFLSERYDIAAKTELPVDRDEMRSMLRSLLEDRFQLSFSSEMKEMDVYALVVAKGGLKFRGSDVQSDSGPTPVITASGQRLVKNISIADLITSLSVRVTDRVIVDKTGLTGQYDIPMGWFIESIGREPDAPSVFNTIGSIGLRLEPSRMPVETLKIDHVVRPSAN